MSKNSQAYLKLDLSKHPEEYAVFVKGKLLGTGPKLRALLQKAKKKFPSEIPAVAKIPGSQTLVLKQNVSD